MSMRKRTRIAAFAGREMAANRGLVSSRSMLNFTGESGLKASSASASTTSIMRLIRLDSIVVLGTALDSDSALASTASEQDVDDRIDQARIDGNKAEIVPLFRFEHREDRRERNGVQIIA